jgi:hypothetical protein
MDNDQISENIATIFAGNDTEMPKHASYRWVWVPTSVQCMLALSLVPVLFTTSAEVSTVVVRIICTVFELSIALTLLVWHIQNVRKLRTQGNFSDETPQLSNIGLYLALALFVVASANISTFIVATGIGLFLPRLAHAMFAGINAPALFYDGRNLLASRGNKSLLAPTAAFLSFAQTIVLVHLASECPSVLRGCGECLVAVVLLVPWTFVAVSSTMRQRDDTTTRDIFLTIVAILLLAPSTWLSDANPQLQTLNHLVSSAGAVLAMGVCVRRYRVLIMAPCSVIAIAGQSKRKRFSGTIIDIPQFPPVPTTPPKQ